MISAICADDEYPAIELIENYCRESGLVNLLKTFTNSESALAYVQNHIVDLVILDIQMPGLNGIDLLQKLNSRTLCIFITADPAYAVKAYELDVIDYLIKPVRYERFTKAIQKAIEYKKYSSRQQNGYIMFKADYLVHKVATDDILWVEGAGEYIKIITRYKSYLVLQRMAEFEEQYNHLGFIRIHKSYLILKTHIKSFHSSIVTLINGKELPVGRTYKNNLHF